MSRLLLIGVLAAAVGGGVFLFTRYEFRPQDGGIAIKPRAAGDGGADRPGVPPADSRRKWVRVATFNLGPLDKKQVSRQFVVTHLADLIRRFDVVAVQGIRARNKGVLLDLVDKVNATGRHFDFATDAGVGTEAVERYSAFLFDKATIEIDRSKVYTVEDPQNRLQHKPLAAMFRARGAESSEAFTFVLVNVHVSADRVAAELDLLDDVLGAVRRGEPDEDDVILLGDLEADESHLGQLGQVPHIAWAVADTLSTTKGTRLADNILFDRRATGEFTGRSGVVDVMRVFNLTMQQALDVSRHMPVWAEFTVHEGGQAGHLAAEPRNSP